VKNSRSKTRILFVEADEAAFQFRKCMSEIIEALPPTELLLATDAGEALEFLAEEKADVLIVDDELTEELEVIVDSIDCSTIPILVQSEPENRESLAKLEKHLRLIPKEESLDHLHQTILCAIKVNEDRLPTKLTH
jgi:chemotaxis response regulator CheB